MFKRGKTWWISFTTPQGKRVRYSAQTEDKQQAQEFHDQLKAEAWRQTKLKERPSRIWDEAGVRWLEEKSHKRSLNDDIKMLRWLQTYLRGKKLVEIDRPFIDRLVREKKKSGVTPATVNRMLALVRSILRKCVEWDWMDSAPVIRLLSEPKRRIRWITRQEAETLLLCLPEHQAELARFALATGLRQGNILSLEWSQIDLARGICWIHPDQAKGGKGIGVPLNHEALSVLRRQAGKHERRVFVYDGKPISQVNTKAWRKALVKAGIKEFRWHDLRHTWASWHVQGGTPLHVLQELGGWESIEMVRRYAHLAPDHLAEYAKNSVFDTNLPQGQLRLVK
ncbi:MAG: tyrosine-type recombinase/integrase [Leptospirillum sp.]